VCNIQEKYLNSSFEVNIMDLQIVNPMLTTLLVEPDLSSTHDAYFNYKAADNWSTVFIIKNQGNSLDDQR
jgi:hypothetical protein